jgi:hypothetical protein
MNEKALSYIKNQLINGKEILKPYVFKPGTTFSYPGRYAKIRIGGYIKKFILTKGATSDRWIIMPGLSGTGKTTILAQLFFEYINKLDSNKVLYISLENISLLDSSLQEILEIYEQILGKRFEESQTPILLFIDEVHRDPQWADVLTSLYNRSRNVMIICSGSSAIPLQTNSNDLGRRTRFEKLYPLCFGEFLMIKKNKFPSTGLKFSIMDALYNSSSASEAFSKLEKIKEEVFKYWADVDKKIEIENFLSIGTLPYAVKLEFNDRTQVFQGIERLLDKIINKDIAELRRFDTETLGLIKKVLFLIADGDVFSINNLSSDIKINAITLSSMIDAIEKSELIIKIPAHGANSKKARKPAKFLFMSPAIRMALLDVTGNVKTFLTRRGKLLEDIAGMHFYREFIACGRGSVSYDSAKAGADFILQIENKHQIAFEIGMGDKDIKQVESTMEKIKCDFGIVVCQTEKPIIFEDKKIIKLPLEYFLLM